MHKFLISITLFLASLILCSGQAVAQSAIKSLEDMTGGSISRDVPTGDMELGCKGRCPQPSGSSTTYTQSPGQAFATGFAGGFLEGAITALLSGPSPAELERRRQAAIAAERARIEEQKRIEERNQAIQARLISKLAPIGGQLPSMQSASGATGIGNGAGGSNGLDGKLVALDASTDAYAQGRMFDGAAPAAPDPVDLRLVDLDTATPTIPKLSAPIPERPRSRLPDKLLSDPRYIEAQRRKALDEEMLAERKKALSALDNQMYDGKIDADEWRQKRAAHMQDIANLENIIARQEGILKDLAKEHKVDPSLIYEDRAELAYLNSPQPDIAAGRTGTRDSTVLAYDRPLTSTTRDWDVELTPEASHLLSTQRLELLNDAKFNEAKESIANLKFHQQLIDHNLEEQRKNYQSGQIDAAEWQRLQHAHNKLSDKIDQDLEVENTKLTKMYTEHELGKPRDGELFHSN